jgi:LuxR family transcriptional regulator
MSRKLGIDFESRRLKQIAQAGYTLGLHIRSSSATLLFRTYPQEWLDLYTNKGYSLCDPLISWGFSAVGACRWSELDYPDPHQVLKQASAFGLNYGIAVSYGPLDSRTVGGFAKRDREFTDHEITEVRDIVVRLHEETTPPERLTVAQISALRLIANGKRHADAAASLGISESALKARLKSARERLLTSTTAEAIQKASEYRLL